MNQTAVKLDEYLKNTFKKEAVTNASKTTASQDMGDRPNADVVGDLFEKLVLGNHEFKTNLGGAIYTIIDAKRKEGETHDELQAKKEKIIDAAFGALKTTARRSIATAKVFTEGKEGSTVLGNESVCRVSKILKGHGDKKAAVHTLLEDVQHYCDFNEFEIAHPALKR